ncbi:hypothetical protein SDC9_158437 [bioreactor metagenome]|uniref:Uncharacterized protein n=1 Tax=bioreactor metagenome TaxID=1076179 RepID=A0A645FBY6_9ZZZZ
MLSSSSNQRESFFSPFKAIDNVPSALFCLAPFSSVSTTSGLLFPAIVSHIFPLAVHLTLTPVTVPDTLITASICLSALRLDSIFSLGPAKSYLPVPLYSAERESFSAVVFPLAAFFSNMRPSERLIVILVLTAGSDITPSLSWTKSKYFAEPFTLNPIVPSVLLSMLFPLSITVTIGRLFPAMVSHSAFFEGDCAVIFIALTVASLKFRASVNW